MKLLFVKLKNLCLNPFVISIGFTVLANLIQVFAFIAQKKLDDENFALLNWGVYVFTFLNIPLESLLKWVTMKLGTVDLEKRIPLLFSLARNSTIPLYLLTFVFSIPFIFINSQSSLIGILCLFSAVVGFWSIFPRAYLNVREKFFEFNLILLIIPIVRLVFTILFVFNGSVHFLFYGLILSSAIAFVLSLFFSLMDSGLSLSSFLNLSPNEALIGAESESVLKVFGNIFLQIALSIFYIADGLILKNILSDYDYSVYVSYSYIYKFPMFAAVGMSPVLLGKSVISDEDRFVLKKTLIRSLMIIVILFGVFIGFEFLFEGFILDILGYSKYVVQGLTYLFGFAWLVQTVVYFMFTYLLKVKQSSLTYLAIFIYTISFVVGLYIFKQNIFTLLWFVLGQGVVFILLRLFLIKYESQ